MALSQIDLWRKSINQGRNTPTASGWNWGNLLKNNYPWENPATAKPGLVQYAGDQVNKRVFQPLSAGITAPMYNQNASVKEKLKQAFLSATPAANLIANRPGTQRNENYQNWQDPSFATGIDVKAPNWVPLLGGQNVLPTRVGVKGTTEGIVGTALTVPFSAAGVSKAVGGLAAKKGIVGAVARGVQPIADAGAVLEAAPGKVIGAGLKSVLPKKTLMPDLSPIDSVIKAHTVPDTLNTLAKGNIPGLKSIASKIAGKGAIAEAPDELALVGLRNLASESGNKTLTTMSTIDRLGSSKKIFGLDDADNMVINGEQKNILTVLSEPGKYEPHLTDAQKTWAKTFQEIDQAKRDFFARNNVDLHERTFTEGGVYVDRKVYGHVGADGELDNIAYVGAGGAKPGGKLSQMKHVTFDKPEDAIAAGYRYMPPEEALRLNVQGAYNYVANKNMVDWLLPKIDFRTTAAPVELQLAKEITQKTVGKAATLKSVINRAARGETIPEATIKSLETSLGDKFNGIRAEINAGVSTPQGLRELRAKADSILKDAKSNYYEAANKATIAHEKAMQVHIGEASINAPAFSGKILTGPEAQNIAQRLNKEFNPNYSSFFTGINKLNAPVRMLAFAGDASVAGIQGIIMAAAHPVAYLKGLKAFMKSIPDEEFIAKFVADNKSIIESSPNMITPYMRGSTEMTAAMGKGGIVMAPKIGSTKIANPLNVLSKVVDPFARGYDAFMTVSGVEMKKALSYKVVDEASNAVVDSYINKMRGMLNTKSMGVGLEQRSIESAIALAPQYTRAVVAIMTDFARGGLRGDLARKALLQSAGATAFAAVGISLAMGESQEEALAHIDPNSKTFLTWNIAGQMVGPGSKVRSVTKLAADLASKPDKVYTATRWLQGNASPVLGNTIDMIAGKDYIGTPTGTRPFDGLILTKNVIADNLLPLWLTQGLETKSDLTGKGINAVAGFVGARAYPAAPVTPASIKTDAYATIESKAWGQYGANLKTISDTITKLESTDPAKAKQMLYQYPSILWARRQIAIQKKQWLTQHANNTSA